MRSLGCFPVIFVYILNFVKTQEPFDQPNHYCPGKEVFCNDFRKTKTNFIRYKFPFEQKYDFKLDRTPKINQNHVLIKS